MSELIDRQQAIDALQKCRKHCIDPFDSYHIDIQDAENQLIKLPTIQPQSTMGQLNDGARSTNLIDRQQAIDGKIIIQRTNGVEIYSDEAVPVEYLKRLPTIQPEPKEGHWIKHETPDGDEQYECSECGVLWEFNDGTPEDNEAYFCPKCGKKMSKGKQ